MFDNRSIRLDLVALGLLAFLIFVFVSLATYDPADPAPTPFKPFDAVYQPNQLVFPANESIQNACGKWGAFTADLLFASAGVGAYYIFLSLAVIDFLLLHRRPIDSPTVRFLGWSASMLGLVTLASMFLTHWSPGPVVGAGGYLGAMCCAILELHFAQAGGFILCLSLIVGGLLLCTDYFLINVAVKSAARAYAMAARGSAVYKSRRGKWVDDEEDEEDTDGGGLRVKISGRKLEDNDIGEEDEAAWEVDDEEEEVEDDESEEDADVDADDESDEEVDETEEEEEPPAPLVVKHSGKKKKEKKRADKPHRRLLPINKSKSTTSDRDQLLARLNSIDENKEVAQYELPNLDLLIEADDICFESQSKEVRRKAKVLEKTFADFGFNVKVVEIETGPVVAQYEVQLEAGLRLSKITGLADDLAIALRVPSVRIVAPIPGKNTVGIEVPNSERQMVRLKEVMEESQAKSSKMKIPLFLGKDVSGNPLVADLSTLPHLLIAGRTGTGKSVCLNAIISSILMTKRPDEVRMLMIDPKMVELSGYGRLPHLMHPVVTDMRKAEAILAWAVEKMEERYLLLARAGVRHISSYNQLSEEEILRRLQLEDEEEQKQVPMHLPFIVIVADEIADLMMTSGKEVEQHIIRLAQKSRAVGIHLILATQKPTVDVITGLIKSNLPARISFQVASRTDSRVVLDEMGADKLLGNGDMLFLWPGTSMLLRGQGTLLSDDEIDRVVAAVSTTEQHFVNELVNLKVEDEDGGGVGRLKKRDEVYEDAIEVIIREGRGSVSLLQRSLGIGYGRAARLIDFMEEDGIVGPYAGSQAREVLLSHDDWDRLKSGLAAAAMDIVDSDENSSTIRPSNSGWDDASDEDLVDVEEDEETLVDEDEDEVEYEEDETEEDEYEEDEEEYEEEECDEDETEEDATADREVDSEASDDEYEEYDNETEYGASA